MPRLGLNATPSPKSRRRSDEDRLPLKAMIESYPAFGSRLRQRLEELGLTQTELARRLFGEGIDERGRRRIKGQDSVSRYCNGKAMPSAPVMQTMIEILGPRKFLLDAAKKAPDIRQREHPIQEPEPLRLPALLDQLERLLDDLMVLRGEVRVSGQIVEGLRNESRERFERIDTLLTLLRDRFDRMEHRLNQLTPHRG